MIKNIALLGQPNSGKSTFYNGLTGSHQHVGNWPGKTVEKNEGTFEYNGKQYTVVDLPGTYSLAANSEEEIVTRDYITGKNADLICILTDASQLERSMFMVADYNGIRVPVVVILNMMDVAKDQGKQIDTNKIQERLGVPVLPFVANEKNEYQRFFELLEKVSTEETVLDDSSLNKIYQDHFKDIYTKIQSIIDQSNTSIYGTGWLFAKVIENDPVAISILKEMVTDEEYKEVMDLVSTVEDGSSKTGICKFEWIHHLLEDAVKEDKKAKETNKFDRYAISKTWGKPLAVGIILVSLVLSILVGMPFMSIGSMIPMISAPLASMLSSMGLHPLLISLLCEALITAFAFTFMMCGYIFGATLVFGFLEEIGYMARISYVFDNAMQRLGLHGKAIMPFLVSFGCNIAGSSGARVLDSWGQRMMAISMSWVVPCGSTWAVVGLVSSVFFGPWAVVIIVLLFAISILHLRITAKVFGGKFLNDADKTGLIMELPPYHKPRWKQLFRLSFTRMMNAFKRAIGIISLVAIVLCLLSYSSTGELSNSILYRIGNAIEPVTMIVGLRWQTFMAWMASWMGKEGALGALASIFGNRSIMSAVANMTLQTADQSSIASNLLNSLTKPEALAFIFAFYFNMPCIMALVSAIHETHSLKWMLRIALYYILMSLLIAGIVYRISLLLF